MRQLFEVFKENEGKEIEELIESEFSGNLQAIYLALGLFPALYITLL